MAGIEKICEYSDEYGFGRMYKWKRDLIQIMPKYRGHFWKKEHTLFIFDGVRKYDTYSFKNYLLTDYCLYVPSLPGTVDGYYWNHTRNLNQTLFNLTKLMGWELNIVLVGSTLDEFYGKVDNYWDGNLGELLKNISERNHHFTITY